MMLGRVKEYTQTSTHGFYVTLKMNCSLDDVRSGKGKKVTSFLLKK